MQTKVIKLSFSSQVHFGKKRLSDGEMLVQADTLFSALFIESLHLGLNTNYLLNNILITDTFPFDQQTYYLPKPLMTISSDQKDDANYKAFKKLAYIPYEKYNDYINGKVISDKVEEMNDSFNIGTYQLQTKAAIENTDSEETEPYSVGTFTFYPQTGIYFIVKGTDQALTNLYTALDSLQYSGLGGKRSLGYGRFSYEIVHDDAFDAFLQQSGEQNILLSTAMGTNEEMDEMTGDNRYILLKRSGFIQSTNYAETLQKKKDFYTFGAGSVFEESFVGEIFDVSEGGKHPVYRYAKAFWLEV